METELECIVCCNILTSPVLLPCCHSLCFHCAISEQKTVATIDSSSYSSPDNSNSYLDTDKRSILSEADSGVVCTSRPGSYVATNSLTNITSYQCDTSRFFIQCKICKEITYMENGVFDLPTYYVMQNIIEKRANHGSATKCHLCPSEPKSDATVFCEQCEVLYCLSCKEKYHPSRGPLAKHTLIQSTCAVEVLFQKAREKYQHCREHSGQSLCLYCLTCTMAICLHCNHKGHDVHPISTIFKEQKGKFSRMLQDVSTKARTSTEILQKMKNMTDIINKDCVAVEKNVSSYCDMLIQTINDKRQELIETARQHRNLKNKSLMQHISECGNKLHQATGFFQYCFEVIKETDIPAFLQVSSILINRIRQVDCDLSRDIDTNDTQEVPESLQLRLDIDPAGITEAIQQLNFKQMKRPPVVNIIPEECTAVNNYVTISWKAPNVGHIEGYWLELDDGSDGPFKVVYCGKETVCTVDGLQYNCLYKARVRAFNDAGQGPYSQVVGLQTAQYAWFSFDRCLSCSEVTFSVDQMTATCNGFEYGTALGTIGFAKGIHYWQFTIDRFDTDADPSFGVATEHVCKNIMLGKDDCGWAMYIDKQRSWFIHGDKHENRCEGGISVGDTVGVLLDMCKRQLRFYVNDRPQGPVAFVNMYGVLYPAVSINRGVTVTLFSGQCPPASITAFQTDSSLTAQNY